MNSNYNDIIDIILTLNEDSDIANNIAISGSIVPYIATSKESEEYHSDFYILVKYKKIDELRNKIKKLSKEYEFDIISDSKTFSISDYGFKIRYQTTTVGFFPYSLIDNDLTIRTFAVNKNGSKANLKTKTIPDINKGDVIKLVKFGNGKLRIMSPEYVLADKEIREKEPGNPTGTTMYLLEKICNPKVLRNVRESVTNTRVKLETKENKKENNMILTGILITLFVILIAVIYICFK